MIAVVAGIALLTMSGAHAPHGATPINEAAKPQIQPVSRDALLRARADCAARITKERPDAKILRNFNLAVRSKNSISRMLRTGPDDVLAFIAPATWRAFGSDIPGQIGCSYDIKDKSLAFRNIEYLRSSRDIAEAIVALRARKSSSKP